MKQKDLVAIIASIFVSAMFSYILSITLISPARTTKLTAEKVVPITTEFNVPDKTVFNSEAVNPTKLIEIGPNTNTQPFTKQ